MSKIYTGLTVKTSEFNTTIVIVTAQRNGYTNNGIPRWKIQVWWMFGTTGDLWTPKIKGYRLSKDGSYLMKSHDIDNDIKIRFMNAFTRAVRI